VVALEAEAADSMSGNSIGVGHAVPDFRLLDQTGQAVALRDLLTTGCLVLYFYPKDDTPGCTVEASTFRDKYQAFLDVGARVVGVSSDDVESHRRFAEKCQIPFQLLSDRDGALRAMFGVPKTLGLIDGRVTYVIDGNGIIRHVFDSQLRARRHVDEALRFARSVQEKRVTP
jgi:peroxiredoxin Q/BCP